MKAGNQVRTGSVLIHQFPGPRTQLALRQRLANLFAESASWSRQQTKLGSWRLSASSCRLRVCSDRLWRLRLGRAGTSCHGIGMDVTTKVWRLVHDIRTSLGADTKKVDVYTYTQGALPVASPSTLHVES